MATLHLIRHGQASFGHSNYDQLSKTGWAQGRALGRFLKGVTQPLVQPQALFAGDMQRHRETATAIAEGYGDELPALVVDPAFNEFNHESVIERFRPEWADRRRMQADLAAEPVPGKAFQKAFAAAVERWVGGGFDHEYAESWVHFRERVLGGMEKAIEQAGDARDTLIITSGGPISIIMQAVLGIGDSQALQINSVLANAGLTRVLYSGERRSLSVFNSTAHLEMETPDLVTFR